MKPKEMNLALINNFPEIINEYCDEVEWQEGDETGSHVVYGDVFSPYIEQAVDKNNTNLLKKIFNFIESLLMIDDDYCTEVIMFSVLERLMSKKYCAVCKMYMRPKTRIIFDKIAQ